MGQGHDKMLEEPSWQELAEEEAELESLEMAAQVQMPKGNEKALERKHALWALHIVGCHQSAELDPKLNELVPTRFCSFNVAAFDLDRESEVIHGPALKEIDPDQLKRSIVGMSVNVVSLKVIKSDVGYPISVYGTVLARDGIDYKCVYMFRRERDDCQIINSSEDVLTLTGPSRTFVVTDSMFFEINLMIKGDAEIAEGDFSKGVVEHCAVKYDKTMTWLLTSWRSMVELVCAPVDHPVEATLEVKILNGSRDAPFNGKVIAWTTGYEDYPIILYEYDDSKATCTASLIGDDGQIALSRNLIAVPFNFYGLDDEDEEIAELNVCFVDCRDEDVCTLVTVAFPCEEKVCKHDSYELQVKVDWTAVLYGPWWFGKNHEEIMERWMTLPPKVLNSWSWNLDRNGSKNIDVSWT